MIKGYEFELINYKSTKSDIGVIVVAFNRRNYVINAVKSVIDQKVSDIKYSITLVKNFKDDKIDKFLKENHVNNIYTNNHSLGYKILLGVILTNSPIISFLEDDDLFVENKLDSVYNKFNQHNDLLYYHNSMIPINEETNFIDKWYKQENGNLICDSTTELIKIRRLVMYGGHNLSSISVKRDLILHNHKIFKEYTYNLDYVTLLLALNSDGLKISDFERLTFYRDHESAIHVNNKVVRNYIRGLTEIKELELDTLLNLGNKITFINNSVKNIYILMLYQHIIWRDFFRNFPNTLSVLEYLRLYKYNFNLRKYLINLIFIVLNHKLPFRIKMFILKKLVKIN